ncbi:MAG: hypothetical protein JOZ87_12010 [Chloroflexi bacterium]|nr:hypothetical protein [Chloroflexota bacterium]
MGTLVNRLVLVYCGFADTVHVGELAHDLREKPGLLDGGEMAARKHANVDAERASRCRAATI